MILAEQLILLALDPERGVFAKGIEAPQLRRGAAAAVIGDLCLHRRMTVTATTVELIDDMPDFHPVLAEATTAVARAGRVVDIETAVRRIESGISGLLKRLLRSLAARDILHDDREAFFLRRYPVRSMQALREVFAHIHAVEAGTHPQPVDLVLATVADGCGVMAHRFSPEERYRVRRQVEARMNAGDPELAAIIGVTRSAAISPAGY